MWRDGGTLTYRRARVLLDRLPGDSATKTRMRNEFSDDELRQYAIDHADDPHGPWSMSDMLTAVVIDKLALVEYAIYRAQGGKPTKPEALPRPGVVDKKKTNAKPKALTGRHFDQMQALRERPKE